MYTFSPHRLGPSSGPSLWEGRVWRRCEVELSWISSGAPDGWWKNEKRRISSTAGEIRDEQVERRGL